MKYLKRVLSWILICVMVVTFGPFFLFGYSFGQLFGTIYYGHKAGRENMIYNMKEFFKWVKK